MSIASENTMANTMATVVLAAGKGTRMHSDQPKVLHALLGAPMLEYVLQAMRSVTRDKIWIVIGHQAEQVRALFPGECFVLQEEQLGTGHALRCAWPEILSVKARWCLVVNGDAPLMDAVVVSKFCEAMVREQVDVGFMTLPLSESLSGLQSYGRVVRDGAGQVIGIVEAKDDDPARPGWPRGEVNAGIYLLCVETAGPLLALISADNKQQEYYLTDLVKLALQQGLRVKQAGAEAAAKDSAAFMGVNCPAELIAAEEALRGRIVAQWLDMGVLVHSPAATRIGPHVVLEPGAKVCGPCELYGRTFVGAGAVVESHVWIKDSYVGAGSLVRAFSHLEGATLGQGCVVGPFARLRPEAVLESRSRVGNFVEMKKSRLGAMAKANHLSYIGDADIGPGANIGAGTITCNYDGQSKQQTIIGAGAFIGSNTALVAPVRVGENALVGAGSVITRDVPDDTIALARGKQQCFPKKK